MNRPTTLLTVQVLRALAALIVVIGHATIELPRLDGFSADGFETFNYGFGVDVFFVISGFIMIHTAGAAFGSPGAGRDFMVARIIRIVPIYWLLTTGLLAAALVLPSLFNSPTPTLASILGSYFFIPVANAAGDPLPILALGWTLNYEMFFYLLFACAMVLPRRAAIVTLLLVLALVAAIGAIVRPDNVVLKFWTDSIILEFAFGILIGVAKSRLRTTAPFVGALLLLAGAALFVANHFHGVALPRFLLSGVPAALIVTGAVILDLAGKPVAPRALVILGGASYSLYLSHMYVVRVVRIAWNQIGLGPSPILFCTLVVVLACGAALMLAYLIELPSHRWLRSRLKSVRWRADKPIGDSPYEAR